jgi:hypothetical protein
MRLIQFLFILGTAVADLPLVAATAGIDTVFLGDAASERDHRLTVVGRAKGLVLETILGSQHRSYPARLLAGAEASLAWTMRVAPGESPIVLEIQEIHDRRSQVFGYTVEVNGTAFYFRTYEEVGAGPNHYFIDVPRRFATDGVLNLTVRSQDDAPVAIGEVRAYGDFERLAREDGTWRPMPVLGQARVLMGVVGTKGKHVALEQQIPEIPPEADAKAWEDLRTTFAKTRTVAGGFMFTSHYLQQNEAELQREIEDSVRIAGANHVMWQYNFMGGDWGGHPSVLDGQGGDFYDIRYSQAVYDPLTKRYAPTWPGTPGGVIWPTAGEPALNQYIIERSRRTGRMLGERIGLLAAQGISPTGICLVGDEGPSYWWRGGFGDFTPTLVAAAARDGVTLSPENLNPAARKWLFDCLTTRFEERCRAITEGLGRDLIPVDRGVVALPDSQLADMLYAHTFMNQSFPLFDGRWEGWQNGANDFAWIGGEPLEYVNPSFADYIATQGCLTNVNLYRPIADFAYLEKLYQWGFRHVALFDAYSDDAAAIVNAMDGVDARPSLPTRHYLRKILDLTPALMPAPTVDKPGEGPLAQIDNLRFSQALDTTWQLREPGRPGRLVIRLEGAGKPLPDGLMLSLDFGAGSRKRINQVTVLAGRDLDHLQPVAAIADKELDKTPYWPGFRTASIPLDAALKGIPQAVVAIDLRTANGSEETGLRQLTVTRPWALTSGHLLGERPTNRQARMRQLWLQDRALANRLLARYIQAGGAAAVIADTRRLISSGACLTAYRQLSAQMSLLLPARFAVRGQGALGPYPLTVSWMDPERTALVSLISIGETSAVLEVDTPTAFRGEVRFHGRIPDQRYRVTVERGNRVSITFDPHGDVRADQTGLLSATVEFAGQPSVSGEGFLAKDTGRVPSRTLVALCHDRELYEVQDPELASYNPLRIPTAKQAVQQRGREGDPQPPKNALPRGGDHVVIELDDAGRARSLRATYGEASGRIRNFTPPAVHPEANNGIIELEDGRSFEIMYRMASFTKFSVPGLRDWARLNSIDDYTKALTPGLTIKLTYSPPLRPGLRPRLLTVTATPSP